MDRECWNESEDDCETVVDDDDCSWWPSEVTDSDDCDCKDNFWHQSSLLDHLSDNNCCGAVAAAVVVVGY